ncbi:MAG TPA: aspartate aminotransferase family protein [Haliangiales bacterium]|nr:aspartate aminotransferase family protein [Haliangiales bacterium]
MERHKLKEIVPAPPAIVRNDLAAVRALFQKNVIPSYARFDIAPSHGLGSSLYDVAGRRYLDLGGGIAVCCLGHAHPEITRALVEQSGKLIHVSNLYYTEPQGRLAEALVNLVAPGKVFFCNSGAEANEGLFKVARKFGHDEGRYEIITAQNSFHGRTLAGIAATGQEKVKKGFEPAVPGFRHVPFNDLDAVRSAISPATVAVLIEGVQGEGGIIPATPEYLLDLRRLCDEKRLLLLIDGVQCGHFRTGRFQSFQRILEATGPASRLLHDNGSPGQESPYPRNSAAGGTPAPLSFLPDGIAMAKSLGGGFPIGAFWVRAPYADLLGPGAHATTYGGTPLACAVALRVLEVIQGERLAENARVVGEFLKTELLSLSQRYPTVIKTVRGLGLMLGVELAPGIRAIADNGKAPSLQFVTRLHEAGLLTIPSGNQVIRLLPPLNLRRSEAEEGIGIIEKIARALA